jgi:dihydrolipoamide dehydrogenase
MFDLLVLGGGPAGYLAAERAGHAGLSVVLVEKRAIGGVCLNEGCIPSKTLLHSAKVLEYAAHGEKYGVTAENARLDPKAVIERKNKVVRTLVAGVKSTLKSCHVTVKEGQGTILGRAAGGAVRVQVGDEVLEAARLLVATGSEPVVPPIPGVKEGLASGHVLTNREILDLAEIPGSLVVVGGGVIGLEMASYFNSVGSKVTVVEMLDHIAGATDLEISALLQKNYARKGVEFRLGAKATGVAPGTVSFEADGRSGTIPADRVLLSIGRRPVTAGFGLETLGVLVERGRIVTDARGRTNAAGVWATGDVNGQWMLAHAAYRESEVAVADMLGKKDRVRYAAVPSVIYTNPEVGAVGETEESCREKGIAYRKVVLPMNYSGRYMAENERGDGICKMLFDAAGQRVIGCHVLGSYASEIIMTAAILVETEMRVQDVRQLVFPHPSVVEILREAAFQLD